MILCMINLIKDLWLMFDNVTLDFGIIINVNVITSIFAIFECCYYWLNKQLTQQRKLKEYGDHGFHKVRGSGDIPSTL